MTPKWPCRGSSESVDYHPLVYSVPTSLGVLDNFSTESSPSKTPIRYHLGTPHCVQYSSDPNLREADDSAGAQQCNT